MDDLSECLKCFPQRAHEHTHTHTRTHKYAQIRTNALTLPCHAFICVTTQVIAHTMACKHSTKATFIQHCAVL